MFLSSDALRSPASITNLIRQAIHGAQGHGGSASDDGSSGRISGVAVGVARSRAEGPATAAMGGSSSSDGGGGAVGNTHLCAIASPLQTCLRQLSLCEARGASPLRWH